MTRRLTTLDKALIMARLDEVAAEIAALAEQISVNERRVCAAERRTPRASKAVAA